MFGLRQRLSLGFCGLLLLVILLGALSITRLTTLGQAIDVILRDNYRSVLACQEMKEALERMDSGELFILSGYEEQGRSLIENNHDRFEVALGVELHNITIPGEGEKAAHLRGLYTRYSTETKAFLAPALTEEARKSAYFQRILPLFSEIKDTADAILHMNQDNMSRANDHARAEAASARRQMYALLLAALLLGAAFISFTGRWILKPIAALIKSTEEISRGNLDLVITPGSRDEIGRLSESFNTMAQSLRAFRRSDRARLARVQKATQQTFRNLPEAVAVLDLSGCVEVATDAAAEAFALRPGAHVQELEPRLISDLFEDALAQERPRPLGEGVIQHFVRGEERFFRPRALPIPGPDSLPAGVLLVLEDVTQWHLQEEMKRGVIAMVSHQLKTPLTSVRMALHLLLEEKVGPLNHKQIDLLLAAREDGDRLHAILEDLLDISRLQSGRAWLEVAPVRCEELVDEALDPFYPSARDRGVKFQEDVPAGLPDVAADRSRVSHAFGNILTNALKYTAAGGSVTVSARAEGDSVRFSVADTGSGIPPEILPHVFEQFYRVPGDKEAGIGLGLAIVKEIVEAHGGAVRAESKEGQGSVFSFTLPRADKQGLP